MSGAARNNRAAACQQKLRTNNRGWTRPRPIFEDQDKPIVWEMLVSTGKSAIKMCNVCHHEREA